MHAALVGPYVACMVALLCVYFSWRRLAGLVALVPVDLMQLARQKVAPHRLVSAAREGSPFAMLVHALSRENAAERSHGLNEALLEMNYALELNRRMPRVLASIGTSSCLLLASLVLREVLSSESADTVLESGVLEGPLASALTVGLWGVFAAGTCVAIYAHTLKLERQVSKSVDAYVDAIAPMS